MVSYPSSCEITTVKPYLGSFNIDVTTPSADAFITLVLSAFISIPVCVIHSFNVSEYIKFSCANSGKLIPGHGGVLDRFDSLILVAPTIYYLLALVF